MVTYVAAALHDVFVLLKLLLVCPVSTCECEHNLSCLHRLKTWLRSTQSQKCLNHVAVCHVHKDELDSVDSLKLMAEFEGKY